MALLEMHEWYDLTRATNWTPGYVEEEVLFPPALSDPYGIAVEQWETSYSRILVTVWVRRRLEVVA